MKEEKQSVVLVSEICHSIFIAKASLSGEKEK